MNEGPAVIVLRHHGQIVVQLSSVALLSMLLSGQRVRFIPDDGTTVETFIRIGSQVDPMLDQYHQYDV